ncbi:MAG: KpsF/GutQ family sugar-phosphate isomerase [SAR86 cluster bacterium]|jgi:arabinose-5-phosphate isomerase|nr:KpsF/GutQ family sugar-phosphate isomerase [SAR86 cluster bacterium]MDG2347012.1 KpsF/GutQ family sugar-phosphate isomerase [SAR86 cluster bacterium]|tara:strand:+ start:14 stop:988 length:975 start_codon:yes stop_codon:yes gene_type:complete
MEDKNFIKSAMKVIEVEGNAVLSLVNQIESDFENLCMEIINTNGKLVLMGIGKSGHIAQKISATLSSTGTPSFFIHPTEAAHGDLGMIDKEDAVLILSNSGETKEIIDILPALKRSTSKIFTLTNNNQSTISKAGKISIVINAAEEACPLDLAPTSSTTIALVFGDALAIALLEAKGFGKDDFARSHPAGQLGKKLTTLVQDIAIMGSNAPKVLETISLKEALMMVTEKKLGVTLISNGKEVVGIFTDGDLRRCLNEGIDLDNTPIKDVMTANFKSIQSDALAMDAAEIMENNKIFSLVVIGGSDQKNTAGVITMHQLLEAGII